MNAFVLRWGNRLFEVLVLGAVVWSTLALGAAWGWGKAVTFGLLAAAFCLWAGMRLLEGEKWHWPTQEELDRMGNDSLVAPAAPPLPVESRLACVLACALGAYVLLQVLPLPVSFLSVLSPTRVVQEQKFWQVLGEPPASLLTLSVDANTTRRALCLFAAAVMAFTAGAYLATSPRRARRVVYVLLVLATVEAIYGLVEYLTGHQQIFWIPVKGDFARGTFYNRNHFAATLALFLPVAIGWFYFRAAAAKSRLDRGHLLPAASWDILGTKQALWLFVPAILLFGIIQSYSRGGFSAMILGTALVFAIGARSRPARALSWLTIPLALALFVYGIHSEYQVVFDRFGELVENTSAEGRTTIWADSLGIMRDYALFGVGLGNFPRVYMQYASVDTLSYPYQAHNEWLEGLITLGMLGMGLVLVTLIAFFIKSFRQIRQSGRDQPWLLGIWCGLIALTLHCFGEFNLHIPSIAVTASLLVGILLGFPVSDAPTVPSFSTASRTTAPRRGGRRSDSARGAAGRSGERRPGRPMTRPEKKIRRYFSQTPPNQSDRDGPSSPPE